MNTHAQSHRRTTSLYVTFAALMVLLAATMALSFLDLGAAQTAVGIGIAVIKTLLVMLVFMNLLRSSSTVRLASGVSLIWLSLFIMCVMSDYLSRGWDETQPRSLQQAEHYKSYDRVEYTAAEPASSTMSGDAASDSTGSPLP